MTFLEKRDLSNTPLIPEYFKGKTVFITGGSGFVGKVLIEKLLYSCSELDSIYVLLRSKKGVSPQERKDEIYKFACFDRLRKERPGLFESKVFIIPGDIGEQNLGMSTEDRALVVNKTNIIFHSAASVRFDDSIKVAAKLNLCGTKQMIELAKDVHNLECFVHVSTAYSNKLHKPIQEKLYLPLMNWRELLEICEMDDHTLQVLTPKLMDEMSNTYVLTKHLAEHMVYEEKGNLPIVIVRPSVVSSSLNEPVQGWNDNFNGPTGIILAALTGLSSVVYLDKQLCTDYIPVDLVVRSLISAAWIRGTKKMEQSDDIPIYNACSNDRFSLTYPELVNMAVSTTQKMPLENIILPASFIFTSSRFIFYVYLLFTRVILYSLFDSVLQLLSKKPRLVKLIRQFYIANLAVSNFILNEWTFNTDNFIRLSSVLKEEDVKEFSYKTKINNQLEYVSNVISGAKRYLLNEKIEDLPKAKAINIRMKYSYMVFKILIFSFVLWYIFSYYKMKIYVSKMNKF